jgi:hypothetical protein
MDHGASIEAKNDIGLTALLCAAGDGFTDCVRLLLDGGADKEAKSFEQEWTALLKAADEGHTDCVRLLLDRGANKEARVRNGWTALMNAAFNGHTDCVWLLLESGASKEIKDIRGRTALDVAQTCGRVDVARLIASFPGAVFGQMVQMVQMDPKRRAKFMGRSCYNCFKTQTAKLQKCGLCKIAQYCSKECQQTNWPRHRTTCDRGGASRTPASLQQCRDELATCLAVPPTQQHDDVHPGAPAAESVKACQFCAKSQAHVASRLKLCNRCRSVRYCSVECQRSDWSTHKIQCSKPGE